MSIVSSICADKGNKVKDKWVNKFRAAMKTKKVDRRMELIEGIVDEMDNFLFSE